LFHGVRLLPTGNSIADLTGKPRQRAICAQPSATMYHVLYSILYHRKKIAVVTCSAVLDSESGRKLLATRNNYHMHAIVGELLSGSAFRLEQAELISMALRAAPWGSMIRRNRTGRK